MAKEMAQEEAVNVILPPMVSPPLSVLAPRKGKQRAENRVKRILFALKKPDPPGSMSDISPDKY